MVPGSSLYIATDSGTTSTTTSTAWINTSTTTLINCSSGGSGSYPAPAPQPVRGFNRFLNASDLLEDFIKDAGIAGIRQSEFLNLPVELFINWLIIKAAEKDGDPIPEGAMAPDQHQKAIPYRGRPRCLSCGRFIPNALAANGITWCDDQPMLIFMQRKGLAR